MIEPYRRSYELLNRHNPHQRFSQLNNCSDDVNVTAISGNVCWIWIPLFINEGIIVFTLKRLLELGSRQAAWKFDAMLLQEMKKQWAHRCDGTWVTGRALEKTLKKAWIFNSDSAVWLEIRVWLSRTIHGYGLARADSIHVNPRGHRTWCLIVRFCGIIGLKKKEESVCASLWDTKEQESHRNKQWKSTHVNLVNVFGNWSFFFLKHFLHTSQSLRSNRDLKNSEKKI